VARARAWDFIVAGGGTAGCILALKLAADPAARVLLVEAGPRRPHPLSAVPLAFPLLGAAAAMNWSYRGDNGRGGVLALRMGRGLGGSSLVNGMVWSRGHPADYDGWAAGGAPGWSFAEVLPWFRDAERYWRGADDWHGAAGQIAVTRAAGPFALAEPLRRIGAARGIAAIDDLAAPPFEGMAPADFAIDRRGRRSGPGAACSARAVPANLRVLTGSRVARILFDGARAAGIELATRRGPIAHMAGQEVILCAGAYQSPQLLMISGLGDGAALRAAGVAVRCELAGVGANLQNHVTVTTHHALAAPGAFPARLRADRLARAALGWALGRGGTLGQVPLAQVAQFRSAPTLDRADVQALYTEGSFADRPWFPLVRPHGGHRMMITHALLRPEARGRVTLASADPLAAPRVGYDPVGEPADVARLGAALAIQREIVGELEREGLLGPADARAPGIPAGPLEPFVRRVAGVSQHPVGTCAMGTGREAVVDPRLRVHGVERLRVVDASVAPTIPGANTYAMTAMIAGRAAALIAADHGLCPSSFPTARQVHAVS